MSGKMEAELVRLLKEKISHGKIHSFEDVIDILRCALVLSEKETEYIYSKY